jgi:deoxyribodipyrimidine photo-lyase
MTTALVLFRRDLRLADNPALSAACAAHARVLPVFIHEPGDGGEWSLGAASRWWLHHSLAALHTRLLAKHASLHLRQGDTLEILRELIQHSGATAVYWNRRYEPASIVRDRHIKTALREEGVEVHSLNSALWFEPWQIATLQDEPYKVFTPYWRKLRPELHPSEPLSEPVLRGWRQLPGGLPLSAVGLVPSIRWDSGLAEAWRPGEAGAKEMLEVLGDDVIDHYAESRDLPARHGTSRLSAHLHFGEISPRQIHFELDRRARSEDARRRPDIEPFLRQLGWREFAHHLLFHYPKTPTEAFNSRFADFRCRSIGS